MKKIQAYLIHGSLGAGKTTILNTILSDSRFNKSAVIENEFANFNIDEHLIKEVGKHNHKTRSITGGCICCSSGTELFEILEEISKNKNINKLLIETTGVANSVDLIKQLILSSSFDDNFELTRNILVIDCLEENINTFIKDKELDIKIADVVLLTKTDISSEAKVKSFIRSLKEIGIKNILKVVNGNFDNSILIDNKKSKSTDTILDNIDLFSLQSSSRHDNNNYYQVVNLKREMKREFLTNIVKRINLEKMTEIKRVKGFIKEDGKEYIVNGTSNAINFIESDIKISKSVLVIIGENITKDIVNKYFNKYE